MGAPPECTLDVRQGIAFGAATSAYQVEGAWDEGGRTASVWDAFALQERGPSGAVAADMVHHFRDDVKLMKALGIKQYRFSVSWNRVVPGARKGSPPSAEGLRFYSSLVDELLAAGITPFGTLFHFDLPESLHDAYQGPLSPLFVEDFEYYAGVVLGALGDRVQHWLTFNEPFFTCVRQYGTALYPPSHRGGLADIHRCGRHVLRAHAAAAALARSTLRRFGLRLGMGLHVHWPEPMSASESDKRAAALVLDWQLGWLADPLFLGRFPPSIRQLGGDALDPLTPEEATALNGSADFFALQYYTSKFVGEDANTPLGFFFSEVDREGTAIGDRASASWQYVVPQGLYKALRHLDARYGQPEVIVTGNGVAVPGEYGEPSAPGGAVEDAFRTQFYRDHLAAVCRAKAEGSRVTGFYAWSLLDNFEGLEGYAEQYGIIHVDFDSPSRNRTVKASARYLSDHFFPAPPPGTPGGLQGGPGSPRRLLAAAAAA
ncbi:MAG: putative prunasin hydrolase isoform PHA precursor [Monoraphidium minutum]|nr:MAG: putative prunasin hydrolase isoform PHA precursor [Monoraphidium minutum]